jgi:hypothetical protein
MEIVKVLLEVKTTQTIALPTKAKILTIETIDTRPWLFALVNPMADTVERVIQVYDTGDPIKSPGKYIGTHIEQTGQVFIYHIFDDGEV